MRLHAFKFNWKALEHTNSYIFLTWGNLSALQNIHGNISERKLLLSYFLIPLSISTLSLFPPEKKIMLSLVKQINFLPQHLMYNKYYVYTFEMQIF